MTTQYEAACGGTITAVMRQVAGAEAVLPEVVQQELAAGRAVLPLNPAHRMARPQVVGRAFRTKVNANIGYSTERSCLEEEIGKLQAALKLGAEFVMDLSVGANLSVVRKAMLEACDVPLGTVPIYEAFARSGGKTEALTAEILLEVIREQAEQGVDFMTLHTGLLRAHVPLALKRTLGITSRGGAILAEWMQHHGRENPLYEHWAEVLSICRKHDITVSLGDGLRPGCLADASDEAQFAELSVLGDLVKECRRCGVQVMVEGPGHVPFDQIRMNMERQQQLCDQAPFYVLGPVVTDIAVGHDHIAAAIGATAAACYGASLLCYVTPAEHLALPSLEDVQAGVVAFRIAAHAGDVARGLPGARQVDDEMSRARGRFDWERQFALALDGDGARKKFLQARPPGEETSDHCTMCGREFCAVLAFQRVQNNANGVAQCPPK